VLAAAHIVDLVRATMGIRSHSAGGTRRAELAARPIVMLYRAADAGGNETLERGEKLPSVHRRRRFYLSC